MYYQLNYLQTVRQQVEHAHPRTSEDWEDPHIIDASAIGKQLIRKLRATPAAGRAALVASLTRLERRFLGSLAAHEDHDLRQRVLDCLLIAPQLAQPRALWRSGTQYFSHATADAAFRLLHQISPQRPGLTPEQIQIVDQYLTSPEDALHACWQLTTEQSVDAKDLPQHFDFGARDDFMAHLAAHFLARADEPIWRAQSTAYLLSLYQGAHPNLRYLALLNAHRIYHSAKAPQQIESDDADHPPVALVRELGQQFSLQERLKNEAPEAWQWWRKLLLQHEISLFFSQPTDPERSRFWQEYVFMMQDLHVNHYAKRLFMDFGGFGIIEFGEYSNAAYVYLKRDFLRYLKLDRSTKGHKAGNAFFKNQLIATRRLIHSGAWQSDFRAELRRLNTRHNPNHH